MRDGCADVDVVESFAMLKANCVDLLPSQTCFDAFSYLLCVSFSMSTGCDVYQRHLHGIAS
jgi:hypothetical protein